MQQKKQGDVEKQDEQQRVMEVLTKFLATKSGEEFLNNLEKQLTAYRSERQGKLNACILTLILPGVYIRPPQQINLYYKISHVRSDSGWKLCTECVKSIQNDLKSIFMTGIGGQRS